MRAYVQQVELGVPTYANFERVAIGFWERGYEVIRFDYPQLTGGFLDRGLTRFSDETIVSGGVLTIREALQRAGRPAPPNIDLPESLKTFVGRRFWTSTLGEVRASVDQEGSPVVHVKPLSHQKLFTGKLIRGTGDLIASARVADETPVLVQEPVEFVSEWRASILRHQIMNIAHYKGDPLLFPSPKVMQAGLDQFVDQPIALGMDWGVTSNGETLLIEVNDGFALGNYGLRSYVYTAMIEARWRELMGLSDNGIGMNLTI